MQKAYSNKPFSTNYELHEPQNRKRLHLNHLTKTNLALWSMDWFAQARSSRCLFSIYNLSLGRRKDSATHQS